MSSGGIFDIEARQERLKALDELMAQPSFWDNQDSARETCWKKGRSSEARGRGLDTPEMYGRLASSVKTHQ